MTRRQLIKALAALAALPLLTLDAPPRVNWREWNHLEVKGWLDGRVEAHINGRDVTRYPDLMKRVARVMAPYGETMLLFCDEWSIGPNTPIHGAVTGPTIGSLFVKFDCDDPLNWTPRSCAYVDDVMLSVADGTVGEQNRDPWLIMGGVQS